MILQFFSSLIFYKIVREFLTTTLVKTSTSILLTDAPGGPGGPIQTKNKTKAFVCIDALLSSYILSCADVSTLYHTFILYVYFLLFIQNGKKSEL